MPSRYSLLLVIALALSSFTHMWNPGGFPIFQIDEAFYTERAVQALKGLGFLHYVTTRDTHPFFGQLFLVGVFKAVGYPDSFNSTSSVEAIEMIYSVPRVLMGVLAVIDTFLIYKIADRRYNKNIALIASILFAVMPATWLLRGIWLDNILLPFLLCSIWLAMYKIGPTGLMKDSNNKINIRRNSQPSLALFSGISLGLAIFTKETAVIFIPLVSLLIITNNKRKWKTLGAWFIPVILIPLIWPALTWYDGHLDKWFDVIQYQTHRVSKPLIDSLLVLFKIDPVLTTLGFAGLAFGAIRKDLFLLIWVIPFLIFQYWIDYVSVYHFIVILPAFCISAAVLVFDLSNRIVKKRIEKTEKDEIATHAFIKNKSSKIKTHNFGIKGLFTGAFISRQNVLIFVIASGIAIFGLVSTTMLVTLNLNTPYFNAVSITTKYLPDKSKTLVNNSNIVTVVSRESDYVWIPKYVYDRDQHVYDSIFWNSTIKNGKYLLIADDRYRGIMRSDNEMGKKLYFIYNNTSLKGTFARDSNYYNLSLYPYTSINDRQVLYSLAIASGTTPGKIEIRTNY